MELIAARVGLTNMYPEQVIRNTQVDMSNQTIDQLVSENKQGGVSRSTLFQAAASAGCLSATASSMGHIRGGWNNSKGLMKMDFIVDQSPVHVKYLHVIGYITNNSAEGLTTDAIFVPQFSWESNEQSVGSADLMNPVTIQRQLGQRVDYMVNDGSGGNNMVSLRPSDVIEYGINSANEEEMRQRMIDEGLDGHHPSIRVAGADISRTGVVASKRANLNPTSWATDILNVGTEYQSRTRAYAGGGYGGEEQQELDSSTYGVLSNQLHQSMNREPNLLRDRFFREMMESQGSHNLRGFNGYSINDLMIAFPNFEEIHDVTMYDAGMYPTVQYDQTAQVMGTANAVEIVAHHFMFNISDLLIRYGLNMITLTGSNCDNFGADGNNGNIVILPSNIVSLSNDDYDQGPKGYSLCQDLENQIFQRLQGQGYNSLTPIRFHVTAELFGSTVIYMTIVDETNVNTGFDMNNPSGAGMREWAFPTFAINNASCVLGSNETAQMAGAAFFDNIQSYFATH